MSAMAGAEDVPAIGEIVPMQFRSIRVNSELKHLRRCARPQRFDRLPHLKVKPPLRF